MPRPGDLESAVVLIKNVTGACGRGGGRMTGVERALAASVLFAGLAAGRQ